MITCELLMFFLENPKDTVLFYFVFISPLYFFYLLFSSCLSVCRRGVLHVSQPQSYPINRHGRLHSESLSPLHHTAKVEQWRRNIPVFSCLASIHHSLLRVEKQRGGEGEAWGCSFDCGWHPMTSLAVEATRLTQVNRFYCVHLLPNWREGENFCDCNESGKTQPCRFVPIVLSFLHILALVYSR